MLANILISFIMANRSSSPESAFDRTGIRVRLARNQRSGSPESVFD
jgi:hypothetical protein